MSFLAEGWTVLKRTWIPLVKLCLVIALLMVALCVALVSIALPLGRLSPTGDFGFPSPGAGALAGILVFLVLLAWTLTTGPVIAYAWNYLVTLPYYPGPARLWPLVRRGFAFWGRLLKVGLWGGLFSLPLFVIELVVMFAGPGRPDPRYLSPTRQALLLLVVQPLVVLLSIYGSFATLHVVRLGDKALQGWKRAFGLIRREEWLPTVGLLAGLHVALALVGAILGLSLGRGPGWWGLLSFLAATYLYFGRVALWHRYTPAPDPAPALAPEEPPAPVQG